MKKILLGVSLVSSLLVADNIKADNTFVSVESGMYREHVKFVGARIGTYFYSDNIYQINNRAYVSADKIFVDNVSCYTTKASLDWIGTTTTLKPFFGVSLGYIYCKDNSVDDSVGTKGVQAGLMYYLGDSFELEVGASWEQTFKGKDTLKKGYGALSYSF